MKLYLNTGIALTLLLPSMNKQINAEGNASCYLLGKLRFSPLRKTEYGDCKQSLYNLP
jgi:hypothetical protein